MTQPESPAQAQIEQLFTVFDGSSPADVSHARRLWSSLSLLPPQESRLVSADLRQRLPVSRPQPSSTGPKPPSVLLPQPPSIASVRQREEERQRYRSMADQRREILALLRRQREQRIHKEMLSVGFKPKGKMSRGMKPTKAPESNEMDKELVRQLH
ncbi:cilia- and flagella-associated protein HOATZ [Scomber scombrus]|uniref:Cilia- and flagella-associated protein HOATZ n=1 Tax=Scomber scombrus TaxID=13677 RepID=A0AAV1Q1M5_SCOSC